MRCSFDALKEQALSCEWREPEEINAPIKSYAVNIIRSGTVIRRLSTEALKFNSTDKLTQGKINTVSVRVVTDIGGAVEVTHVNFTNSGMSTSILSMNSFVAILLPFKLS